jgi:hypothetical protein
MENLLAAMDEGDTVIYLQTDDQNNLLITISAGGWIFVCLLPDPDVLTTVSLSANEETLLICYTALLKVLIALMETE